MKLKKILYGILIIILLNLLLNSNAQAVQSRPDVSSQSYNPTTFFAIIRQMETSSGPMGLDATVDDTGKETSESNNIDVHMAKNTEWGTAAMLAASAYGDAQAGQVTYAYEKTNGSATTRNSYGIYQMCYGTEYVAGIWDMASSFYENLYNAEDKYVNKYSSQSSILGDATLETERWLSSGSSSFISAGYVFARGGTALFQYSGNRTSGMTSRAAVVCGNGF